MVDAASDGQLAGAGGCETRMRNRPPAACTAATAASVRARSPALLTIAFQLACMIAADRTIVSARGDKSAAKHVLDDLLTDCEGHPDTAAADDPGQTNVLAGRLDGRRLRGGRLAGFKVSSQSWWHHPASGYWPPTFSPVSGTGPTCRTKAPLPGYRGRHDHGQALSLRAYGQTVNAGVD